MHQPLAIALRELRELLGHDDDPLARYDVGALVADIKHHPAKYGQDAVARLALEGRAAEASLYRYARVAEVWTRTQVVSLLASLSWSHLVMLAQVKDRKARNEWIGRARREKLTFRQLQARLRSSILA